MFLVVVVVVAVVVVVVIVLPFEDDDVESWLHSSSIASFIKQLHRYVATFEMHDLLVRVSPCNLTPEM